MADVDVNNSDIKLLSSNIKFHNFNVQVGEVGLACEVILMQDSLFLWIGDCNEGKMSDLSFGFMSTYESIPVATKIMGSTDDTTSSNMAKRFTKKFGKPVYISFNTAVNHMTLQKVERNIYDELKKHPDIMTLSYQ